MAPFDLAETVAEHDRGEHATVRFYGVLAAVLAVVSYLAVVIVLRLLTDWPGWLRHGIAWAAMAALIWEARRYAAHLRARDQALAAAFTGDQAACLASQPVEPDAAARALSVLLAAPRLGVLAWRARGAALAWDEARCRRGQALFQRLGEQSFDGAWTPLRDLTADADLLPGFARLDLIDWQAGSDGAQVRLRPRLVKRYFTKKAADPFAAMMNAGKPPARGG